MKPILDSGPVEVQDKSELFQETKFITAAIGNKYNKYGRYDSIFIYKTIFQGNITHNFKIQSF